MALFAKLGLNSKVIKIHCVVDSIVTTEQAGIDFLNNLYKTNDVWRQTSYNTQGGVHLLGGTPFRKNYAGVGYEYDSTRDAFIPLKPYQSWTLNEDTCLWEASTVKPDDGKVYKWNESTTSWDEIVSLS